MVFSELAYCELSEHFLHNRRTHDFEKDVTITLIEQIRKEHLELIAKRDLLRRREIFWQLKLNTVQPHGPISTLKQGAQRALTWDAIQWQYSRSELLALR